MARLSDYLDWRGDLPFDRDPCNEADAYLLAKIGVPDLRGIVPEEGPGVPLKEAYAAWYGRTDIDPDYLGRLNQKVLSMTLRRLPETERFGSLLLSDYLEIRNEAEDEQISALTITLPGGLTAVTYRGTDDTIVGWKENFLMGVRDTVRAQEDALEYLKRVAERHPGPLALMGHSKGGNLAVFAAALAPGEIRDRIRWVYNFDGPGFREEFLRLKEVGLIRDRVRSFLPQSSMVGILLRQVNEPVILRCDRSGPTAHEGLYWEVLGTSFVREEKLNPMSVGFGRLIEGQMRQRNEEELSRFVEDFFAALTSTGAVTLTDLSNQSAEQFHRLLRAVTDTPSIRGFGKDILRLVLRDRVWMRPFGKRP